MSYLLTIGVIPEGLLVCHKCDNGLCVRPDHLFLGTPLDNARDRNSKGRGVRGTRATFAKLSESDVREVRRLKAGGMSQKDIAKRFNISNGTITHIKTRSTWDWLV